jgi:hypothetical protein
MQSIMMLTVRDSFLNTPGECSHSRNCHETWPR